MSEISPLFLDLSSIIFEIRGQKVMLDSMVAMLYGVETKRINEAVKNNPDKFPPSYMFRLNNDEFAAVKSQLDSVDLSALSKLSDRRSKISTFNIKESLNNTRRTPAAFSEKGLYMLATILKSKTAIDATFAIIETFASVRELKSELLALHNASDKSPRRLEKFGEKLADIIMPDLQISETESTLELNFIIGKIKHSVKRIKKAQNE